MDHIRALGRHATLMAWVFALAGCAPDDAPPINLWDFCGAPLANPAPTAGLCTHCWGADEGGGSCQLSLESATAQQLELLAALTSKRPQYCAMADEGFMMNAEPVGERLREVLDAPQVTRYRDFVEAADRILLSADGDPELLHLNQFTTYFGSGDVARGVEQMAVFTDDELVDVPTCCVGERCGAEFECVAADWHPRGMDCFAATP